MSTENVLRQWELFSHFADSQLDRLAGCAQWRQAESGTAIVREGEPSLEAYFIAAGGVRIQRKTPYGLFTLATLKPGDLFGETSFVDGNARSGDAMAIKPCQLMALNPQAISLAMESDPAFSVSLHWAFWKSLSFKLRQTNDQLTRFFSKSGKPPSVQAPAAPGVADDFRVDLASKRKLFQEQKLSSLEINFLASLSREKKFAPHQQIFREGEQGDEMYVLLEGRVMISKFIPGAGEEALAFLERGDYFGEMALIDNRERSADATASDQGAVVLAIPREVLVGILDIQRVSSLRLLRLLCTLVARRLRELDDKIIGWFILAGGSATGWPVGRDA